MRFEKKLALEMYGVSTENDLREKIMGERSGITEGELQCILKHLLEEKDPVYCEVGVYFGGTFAKVMEALKKKRRSAKRRWSIGIDLFENLAGEEANWNQTHELYNKWNILNVAYKHSLDRKLKELGYERFELIKGSSDIALNGLIAGDGPKPTLIFLDGNHSYNQTLKDFLASRALLQSSSGGTIVFHNASDNIRPDQDYVEKDGGPWKVCKDIQESELAEFVEQVERCQVFRVKKL